MKTGDKVYHPKYTLGIISGGPCKAGGLIWWAVNFKGCVINMEEDELGIQHQVVSCGNCSHLSECLGAGGFIKVDRCKSGRSFEPKGKPDGMTDKYYRNYYDKFMPKETLEEPIPGSGIGYLMVKEVMKEYE